MGHYARVPVDSGDSIENDAALSSRLGPIRDEAATAPVSGSVQRNGRAIAFTLENGGIAPEVPHVMTEQVIMAALLVVSFIVPIFHLLG